MLLISIPTHILPTAGAIKAILCPVIKPENVKLSGILNSLVNSKRSMDFFFYSRKKKSINDKGGNISLHDFMRELDRTNCTSCEWNCDAIVTILLFIQYNYKPAAL